MESASKDTPKGYISAFNRSHYEDVLVPRVHGGLKKDDLKRRFRYIRQFEEMLVEEGTTIIKLFLHISKEKQLKKIKERLEDPKNTGNLTQVIYRSGSFGMITKRHM